VSDDAHRDPRGNGDAVGRADLQARLATRDASVGVIGLGYVGLPLSLAFADAGFDVAGFDVDGDRVARLRDGDSYVDDVSDAELAAGLDEGFEPSDSSAAIDDCDAYVLAVPTGVRNGAPAMEAIEAAAATVAERRGDRETLVVVSSTVYPGATREVVAPTVLQRDVAADTRFAMVPERLNPGGDYDVHDIPLVVGADADPARAAAVELFESVVAETVPVGATETAELSKTLENTYRMVNIALVNQLVSFAEELEADVWEAIDAAGTKPFGFQAFTPGPGVGGHCIPIDPQFLTWRAEQLGTDLPLIEHAHRINESMPDRVVEGVTTALEARGVDPDEASILLFGAAYKPNVADPRNAPAIEVYRSLDAVADVTLVDPHVDPEEAGIPILQEADADQVADADASVLLVDHDAFDLAWLGETAQFVFDVNDAVPDDVSATVVALGERPAFTGKKAARRSSD